jgi:predicted MFS family arabinose efflux permease
MPATGSEPIQVRRSVKLRLILSAVILLVLALGFNALLSLNSLEKVYVESIASQYSAFGEDLQRTLEQKLKFVANIEKFPSMQQILQDTKQNLIKAYFEDTTTISESNVAVMIVLPNGTILDSTETKLIGTLLPDQVRPQVEAPEKTKTVGYVKYQNRYFTSLPVRDATPKWVATAMIAFDEAQVKMLLNTVRDQNIQVIVIILGGSIVLLFILLSLVIRDEAKLRAIPKLWITLVMLVVIGSAQLVFSGFSTNAFGKYYLQINKQKAKILTTLQKGRIESWGRYIEQLSKMETVLATIIKASPELSAMLITNNDQIPFYMATKTVAVDFQKATAEQLKAAYTLLPALDPDYTIRLNLFKGGSVEGSITTVLSKDVIFGRLFEIGLDSLTVLLISMLFFGELLLLIFQFAEQPIVERKRGRPVHYEAMRPAAFLFLFGIDICISFLPIYMETLYVPILGLSKDMVMGLPISAKVFFAGIAILIAGAWVDRRGWYEPFFTAMVLVSGGYLYSWLAPNALHFILSRCVVGFGYGLGLMASQGFIFANTDESNKTQGLSHFWAGVYAGSICGSAIGAMLAERIGYRPVFFVGMLLVGSVIVYAMVFMRHAIHKPVQSVTVSQSPALTVGQIFRFVRDRNILALILFSSVPAAIISIGLLDYFSPVYLNRIGVSQSNIGRIFMIQGLCIIYLAPIISRYVDASKSSKKKFIMLGGVLGSAACLAFYALGLYVFGGLLTTAIAVLLLGLSESFSDARSSFVLKLNITQAIGTGKAMGVFSSAARIGQVVGPMLFGWMLVSAGIYKGLLVVGLVYLVVSGFLLVIKEQQSA